MKINTTKPYHFTGDLYGYELITSADGTVTETRYVTVPTQVSMSITVNLLGELIIESPNKMQINSYLRNIVDKNGEEIYVNGGWKVTQTAPLLNSLGEKAGYKYRAVLFEGQI